jgi:hypothetical protein
MASLEVVADGAEGELTWLLAKGEDLLWSGHVAAAVAQLDSAATMNGSVVERYSVGEALLRATHAERGWDLYDLHPSRPVDQLADIRRWDWRPCPLLVVVAEQGFGDALQFLRFVPSVTALADQVVVAVHDRLLTTVCDSPALAGTEVIAKSAAHARAWPTGTRWERLMSLPARIGGLRAEPIGPYLNPPGTARRYCHLPQSSEFTIGVAWRSTARRGVASRSIPARLMSRLAVPGVRLVSLHRSVDISALPAGVDAVQIDDFVDTAYVMSQCDLVVTSDTVTAHLAPALGVPTIICLRHRPDWRWGTPKYPTRWYAAAQLLFQDEARNWSTVIAEATDILQARATAPLPVGSR